MVMWPHHVDSYRLGGHRRKAPASDKDEESDMTITTSRITAVAGLCAAVAGAIYVGVQINHPPADVAHVVTTDVLVRETAKALMAVLALAGFAGMFLRNRHRFGALGITGYL